MPSTDLLKQFGLNRNPFTVSNGAAAGTPMLLLMSHKGNRHLLMRLLCERRECL